MKQTLLLILSMAFFVTAKTQNSYDEALQQGDEAFKNGDYKLAINKYFAAQAFDPSQRNTVKEKVNTVFDKIESLRQEAINAEKDANKATSHLQATLDELKKQTDSLVIARAQADSINNVMLGMRKTMVGVKYQGGIVCFWNDSTGKHGLIAAPGDIEGIFTWQKAKDTCEKLSLNGYDDWHLPSEDELGYLYSNRNVIGGFQRDLYWSSSEHNQPMAFCLTFDFGVADNWAMKTRKFHVRPVRAF